VKRIAVFCGARPGANPAFMAAGRELGAALAHANLGLVYGGASVGIMGAVADAALEAGGEAIGVIPRGLEQKEIAHRGLTQLHVVQTMHERKLLMNDLADGFCTLPGGIGTLEELFEVVSWAALGIHAKPCCLVNVGGYYDGLLGFLDHAVSAELIGEWQRPLILSAPNPRAALTLLATRSPPDQPKVLDESQT